MIMAVAGVVIVVVVGHGGSACASVLWEADLGGVSWDQEFEEVEVVKRRYFDQQNHHQEAVISMYPILRGPRLAPCKDLIQIHVLVPRSLLTSQTNTTLRYLRYYLHDDLMVQVQSATCDKAEGPWPRGCHEVVRVASEPNLKANQVSPLHLFAGIYYCYCNYSPSHYSLPSLALALRSLQNLKHGKAGILVYDPSLLLVNQHLKHDTLKHLLCCAGRSRTAAHRCSPVEYR